MCSRSVRKTMTFVLPSFHDDGVGFSVNHIIIIYRTANQDSRVYWQEITIKNQVINKKYKSSIFRIFCCGIAKNPLSLNSAVEIFQYNNFNWLRIDKHSLLYCYPRARICETSRSFSLYTFISFVVFPDENDPASNGGLKFYVSNDGFLNLSFSSSTFSTDLIRMIGDEERRVSRGAGNTARIFAKRRLAVSLWKKIYIYIFYRLRVCRKTSNNCEMRKGKSIKENRKK